MLNLFPCVYIKNQVSDSYTDSKPAITTYILQHSQTHWDQQQYNKLHAIKPQLGYQALTQFSRHDAIVLR